MKRFVIAALLIAAYRFIRFCLEPDMKIEIRLPKGK